MDSDSLLDNAIAEIIWEIVFNESLFENNSYHFGKFDKFVSEKLIKIKLRSDSLDIHNDEVAGFLQLRCCEYAFRWPEEDLFNIPVLSDEIAQKRRLAVGSIEYSTSLSCEACYLGNILELFEERKLSRLKLIKVYIDFYDIGLFDEKLVQIMIDWCRPKNIQDQYNKKRLVLSLRFNYVGPDEPIVSELFARLLEVNRFGDFEFDLLSGIWCKGADTYPLKSISNILDIVSFDSLNSRKLQCNAGLTLYAQSILSICKGLEFNDCNPNFGIRADPRFHLSSSK
ncbi:unnamed protein product [Ambrosiozyma monospora]|uniref:Unnamed protein product n=1 Tax=Ambrosiozyma monospora TaxID=43982 RepID=A0ACB5T3S0_AMBMO|nr:unnamed protein product [Ambrosiozyma monospora]